MRMNSRKIFVLVREKEREGVGVCVVTRFLKQVVVNRCNDGSEVIPTSLMDVYFSSSRIWIWISKCWLHLLARSGTRCDNRMHGLKKLPKSWVGTTEEDKKPYRNLCQTTLQLGRWEPWYSGERSRLTIRRLWVWISAAATRWTFFILICSKICVVCWKRLKIKEKRPR